MIIRLFHSKQKFNTYVHGSYSPSASTLLAGHLEGHPACKKSSHSNFGNLPSLRCPQMNKPVKQS